MGNGCPRIAPLQAIAAKARALIRDEQGETITETLVSVLIGGLALLMLAVVLATSNNIISESKQSMNEYYAKTNAIASETHAPSEGNSVSVTLKDASGNPLADPATVNVNYSVNDVIGETIVAYWAV